MADRQGQSSSFPTSKDQFVIKKPIDANLALSSQDPNSLEQAAHINHYFDAVYNIENHVLSGSGGAGGSLTSITTGSVYGDNVLISSTTLTFSMTGNAISATALVPTGFGSDPFNANGFSMAYTTYVNSRAGSANTQGLWANKDYGTFGSNNDAFKFYQFFTMISPVSGRTFQVNLLNIPIHSSTANVTPTFIDNMKSQSYMGVPDRTGWAGVQYNNGFFTKILTNGFSYYAGYSERENNNAYAFVYAKEFGLNLTNGYIEFGPWVEGTGGNFLDSDEVMTRMGPAVRIQGSAQNASFYCLAVGDVDAGVYLPSVARLVLVQGTNLSTPFSDGTKPVTGAAWSPKAGCTVTPLNNVIIDLNQPEIRYRLQASGSVITVHSAASPYSSWTQIASASNSTLTSGGIGWVSQAMQDSNNRYQVFRDSIKIADLSTTPLSVQTKLIFFSTPNVSEEAG